MKGLLTAIVVIGSLLAAGDVEARRRYRVRYGYRAYGHVHAGGPVVMSPLGGWYAGAGLFGTRILDQAGGSEQLQSGGGLSLWGGLHVNDVLSLEFGWMGSLHNPATVNTWYGPETDFLVLDALTADARFHLRKGEQGSVDPYVQAGLGFYALSSEHLGLDSVGSGFQLGGGFDWYAVDKLTLGLRVRYHGIAMGPPDGRENDVFISAATVEGSVAVHF